MNLLSRKIVIAGISAAVALSGGFIIGQAPRADAAASSTVTDPGSKTIAIGKRFLGTPYKFGAASGSTKSFDCSSFTQYVYKQIGINLARGARDQYSNGVKISRSQLKVGDLVFFSTPATVKYKASLTVKRIGHVGIYAGNNKVLHTYGEGGVKISNMASGWWDNHYVAAARYIGVKG